MKPAPASPPSTLPLGRLLSGAAALVRRPGQAEAEKPGSMEERGPGLSRDAGTGVGGPAVGVAPAPISARFRGTLELLLPGLSQCLGVGHLHTTPQPPRVVPADLKLLPWLLGPGFHSRYG